MLTSSEDSDEEQDTVKVCVCVGVGVWVWVCGVCGCCPRIHACLYMCVGVYVYVRICTYLCTRGYVQVYVCLYFYILKGNTVHMFVCVLVMCTMQYMLCVSDNVYNICCVCLIMCIILLVPL